MTRDLIVDWYEYCDGRCYVAFSGGKDSKVLLHLVHKLYPDVPAVFSDTGLEYPEIRQFAKDNGAHFIRPKMDFIEITREYGYPLISKEIAYAISSARRNYNLDYRKFRNGKEKPVVTAEMARNTPPSATTIAGRTALLGGVTNENGKTSRFNYDKWLPLAQKAPFRISSYCCDIMKKNPSDSYSRKNQRKPFIGMLATESKLREQKWLKTGCNAYGGHGTSNPLSFWTEQDILQYIKKYDIEICPLYGDIIEKDGLLQTTGYRRTGCSFCGFGAHLDKGETRFRMMQRTHPDLYKFCIDGGGWVDNPEYIEGLGTEPYEDGWVPWNPKKLWMPTKDGLGMGFVFDYMNSMYGTETVLYK